jgi:hypothetical protein
MVDYIGPSDLISYGVVGDGVTDDTAALQSVFNAFGNVGGTIRQRPGIIELPHGVIFKTSDTLFLKQARIHIIGNHAGIRQVTANKAALKIGPNPYVNHVIGCSVKDLHIQSAGNGIEAESAPQLRLIDNHFKDFSSDGSSVAACAIAIKLSGCVASEIIGNQIDKTTSIAIWVKALNINWVNPAVVAESQRVIIERNRIYRSGSVAILVSEGGGHQVLNNDIEACYSGIDMRSAFHFLIKQNYFEATTGVDIAVQNVTDLVALRTIQGGIVTENECYSTNSIYLYGGEDIRVLNNKNPGANFINTGVLNTKWAHNIDQGSFSNLGTGTVFTL